MTAGSHALGPVHRRLRHGCQLWGLLGAVLTGCIAPSTFLLDDAGAVPEQADRVVPSDLGDDRVDAGDGAAPDATADVPSDLGTDGTDTATDRSSADGAVDVPEEGLDVVCPASFTRCRDSCADLANDPAHCGECYNRCGPVGTCFVGGCVADASVCPAGRALCGGACVDTRTDPLNCGECANACAEGSGRCVAGGCDTPDAGCPRGRSLCGETCVDTETDPLNCGECGNACGEGLGTCMRGGCLATAELCPRGQSLCIERCVDTNTDPMNCGECSNQCGNARCVRGGCQ